MPELPENERPSSRHGSASNRNELNNAINNQLNTTKKRVGSATYYDIASTLLGQGRSDDLDEIFLSAARVSLLLIRVKYLQHSYMCN